MAGGSIQGIVDVLMRPWVASCEETRERLSAHMDGELGGREARRVLRHLARCPRCREVLRSLARAVDGLRSVGPATGPVPVPSTADAVVDRIRRGGL